MKVVLDTNILVSDFSFTSRPWTLLLESARRADIRVCLPQVVLDEAANKYAEASAELEAAAQKLTGTYRRMTGDDLKLSPSVRREKMAKHYLDRLSKVREQLCAEVLPYPTTPHASIVTRLLAQRKPFKKGDIGYRDCLIWESVMALLERTDEAVVLVTANTTDFAGDDRELHADLLGDLSERSVPRERLQFFPSLEQFTEKYVVPTLRQLESYLGALKSDSPPLDLFGWAKEHLAEELKEYGSEFTDEILGIPGVGVFVHDIKVVAVRPKRAFQLPSGIIMVECAFDVETHVTADSSWEDIVRHPEARDYWGMKASDDEFSFISSSAIPQNLTIWMDLRIDPNSNRVIGLDLGSTEPR